MFVGGCKHFAAHTPRRRNNGRQQSITEFIENTLQGPGPFAFVDESRKTHSQQCTPLRRPDLLDVATSIATSFEQHKWQHGCQCIWQSKCLWGGGCATGARLSAAGGGGRTTLQKNVQTNKKSKANVINAISSSMTNKTKSPWHGV